MAYLQNFKRALRDKKERIKTKLGSSSEPLRKRSVESAWVTRITQPDADAISPLLERLPFEIRLQIWEEVLGGNLFHMTIDPPESDPHLCMYFETCDGRDGWRRQTPHLGRYLCCDFSEGMGSTGKASYPRCQGSQAEPCFFASDEPAPFRFKPLSLLMTCRQIYDEAVGLLYSTNTFNFDYEEVLSHFLSSDARRHVKHIRRVHVNSSMWRIVEPEIDPHYSAAALSARGEHWPKLWPLLLELENLQHVRLDIYGTSKCRLQVEDLDPVRQLRGLMTFDLAIWRDIWNPDSPKQDLSLSVPLQESIRMSVCK
ncbi:MAG: hypothetical protein Q9221_004144 [Calogaya cf. arnoldii]